MLANIYLSTYSIIKALKKGANIIIYRRVVDASPIIELYSSSIARGILTTIHLQALYLVAICKTYRAPRSGL
jgi:hypothetical protein